MEAGLRATPLWGPKAALNIVSCYPKLEEPSLKTAFKMAVMGAVMRDEIENVQGRALVRRFTGELTGQTTLECATITAQQDDDAIAVAQMEARTRGLFEDEDGKSVQAPALTCVLG